MICGRDWHASRKRGVPHWSFNNLAVFSTMGLGERVSRDHNIVAIHMQSLRELAIRHQF